ncbi:histidine phosphatase family protein [uncultured Jatrophihabitans sp.]|uniref:histidine phosphatase family protein n=1 Tax=uncultured Jatrophihabitans sp. TaxID=1610747 RepID=UPI0035CAF023
MTSVKAGSGEPAFVAPELADGAQIWLLRHGETEWSASGQHTSTTDLPLTDAGERQARGLRELIGDLSPALVLSSPRERAVATARLAGLRVDETTEDLAEWNYGAYEGRTTSHIRDDVPDWSIWTHGVPAGETAEQVAARADRVLTRAAAAAPDGPVVLVGHGHFSRVLGARWIGLPVAGGANLLLSTAATAILSAQYGQPVLDRWNLPNPTAES